MNVRNPLHAGPRLLALGCLLLPAACRSTGPDTPPPPGSAQSMQGRQAEITNEFVATAEVVSVARDTRVVTVRREDGTQLEVAVGPAVRNFEQIAPGDGLKLHYRETIAVAVVPPGTPPRPAQVGVGAARAKPGEKPGAGLGAAISLRVKVESIDTKHDIVVFSPASGSGELLARRVRTDKGREFVRNLAVGDQVQLDYLEVVALEVTEL